MRVSTCHPSTDVPVSGAWMHITIDAVSVACACVRVCRTVVAVIYAHAIEKTKSFECASVQPGDIVAVHVAVSGATHDRWCKLEHLGHGTIAAWPYMPNREVLTQARLCMPNREVLTQAYVRGWCTPWLMNTCMEIACHVVHACMSRCLHRLNTGSTC